VEPADLPEEIRQIVPLVTSSIPKNVAIVLQASERVRKVDIDRAQFQQLVMNLVINGAEAIEESSGTVTVTTYETELDAAEASRRFPNELMPPGPYAVMEVRDTGAGMDPATQAKIFDPFFTTKFTGRGLGLAAVMGIVRGHKGAIQVESTPGAGSVFRVFLPVNGAAGRVAEPVFPRSMPEIAGEAATVLVIDDEEVVRLLARRALTSAGYQVLLAANGREGIDLFNSQANSVAAIVLDLEMPVMSGEEALHRLREINPSVRVLASSGYSQIEALRRFGASIAGFVQKPYSAQSLLSAVNHVIRNPGHARGSAADS
jgi:CheY-like chemotaxis protein